MADDFSNGDFAPIKTAHAKFSPNVFNVIPHGSLANAQSFRRLPIATASGHRLKNLNFPIRQLT